MVTPPTRVGAYEPSVGNYSTNTTPKTTVSFDIVTGDMITLVSSAENGLATLSTPTDNTSGKITWSLIDDTGVGDGNVSLIRYWKGDVTASHTGATISMTRGGSGNSWGMTATPWRDHGGLGLFGKLNSQSLPQLSLTCSDNSALTGQINDWNALSGGGTRSWLSINGVQIAETTYYSNTGVTHTVYGGRSPDVGAAGSKTFGLSAPSGQKAAIIVVEVLGLAGTGPVAGSLLMTEDGLALTTDAGVPLILE